jgi:hypothetical protein
VLSSGSRPVRRLRPRIKAHELVSRVREASSSRASQSIGAWYGEVRLWFAGVSQGLEMTPLHHYLSYRQQEWARGENDKQQQRYTPGMFAAAVSGLRGRLRVLQDS